MFASKNGPQKVKIHEGFKFKKRKENIFSGAQAPLQILLVKKKVSNGNKLLSPASTCTKVRNSLR